MQWKNIFMAVLFVVFVATMTTAMCLDMRYITNGESLWAVGLGFALYSLFIFLCLKG